jgi:3-phosphoshikimate 1-carboxyvinyltransferase
VKKEVKVIQPVSKIRGRVRLPGSKSITHRALLMAALAEGESRIDNPLRAEDTILTAQALRQLGARLIWEEEAIRLIPPRKLWTQPREPIRLGNSGTGMRLLVALAAAGEGKFIFDGSPRLRERPIGPVLESLGKLGIHYRYLHEPGYPPAEIVSHKLGGGEVWVDARQSSQFLSALLIVSPCAKKEIFVGWKEPVASFPYVRITLGMMERWGIRYRWLGSNQIAIPAPQKYSACRYQVEGDCSSASYFWGAAALTEGEVFTYPISSDSLQGDCRFLEVLEKMGCRVRWKEDGVAVMGSGSLKPVEVDMNAMPDMVPTLAVLAAFAPGRSQIRNVAHLRIKESDRLHVVASELSKLGVFVEELPDGLIIEGGGVRGASVEAHEDHRIAMAFALAGLRAKGVEIHGAEAVTKSFPSFWEIFKGLCNERL